MLHSSETVTTSSRSSCCGPLTCYDELAALHGVTLLQLHHNRRILIVTLPTKLVDIKAPPKLALQQSLQGLRFGLPMKRNT